MLLERRNGSGRQEEGRRGSGRQVEGRNGSGRKVEEGIDQEGR
jgi:hypothetical protein